MCVLKSREKKGRLSRKKPPKLHNKFSNDDCYQRGWKNEKEKKERNYIKGESELVGKGAQG